MWQYIVLLGAVVAVAAFAMPRKKQEGPDSAKSLGKMELALEQFMENMEHDNKELAELVAEALKQANDRADSQARKIDRLKRELDELKRAIEAGRLAAPGHSPNELPKAKRTDDSNAGTMLSAPASEEAKTEEKQPEEASADSGSGEKNATLQSRYAELLELYRQGKSVEAIAKRLRMNKGEVQLVLKLARREAAAHGE
jgi:DNA-binding NarL/FixJ family response regulator